jgi:hypothetical protein
MSPAWRNDDTLENSSDIIIGPPLHLELPSFLGIGDLSYMGMFTTNCSVHRQKVDVSESASWCTAIGSNVHIDGAISMTELDLAELLDTRNNLLPFANPVHRAGSLEAA